MNRDAGEGSSMLERLYKRVCFKGQSLGARGEAYARKLVEERGLVVLHQNFRVPRGEVDLVARDGDTIVFIEVKTRATQHYGQPFEAVGLAKQRKISCAAQAFLKRFDLLPACRFDVISIRREDGHFVAEWIKDAFEAG